VESLEQVFKQYPFLSSGYQRVLSEELIQQDKTRENLIQERFQYYLHRFLCLQFGLNYVTKHRTKEVTFLKVVEKNIKLLFETGMGSIYFGSPGNGKSHILLETCRQILTLEWNKCRERLCVNDFSTFFEKTVQFYYLPGLCEILRKREPIRICRYNFLDDFGTEEMLPSTLSALNSYFEEINRRGYSIVATSNGSVSDFVNRPRLERITSRMAEICRFFTLPDEDLRKKKTGKINPIWQDR